MIEKPDIRDEKIISALEENYSIQANVIEFLPVGNDATAFTYRIETKNEDVYFLKLKRNLSNPGGLFVSRFLQDSGMKQVIAPIPTQMQKLIAEADGFSMILYPFIAGHEAMKVGMSDAQWIEFGSVLKRIHLTQLPDEIAQHVRQESFIPTWSSLARELHNRIHLLDFDDPYQQELALFWKENGETIQTLMDRVEILGKQLQQMELDFVLCHADIHTANIVLTQAHDMFIVDWDDALLAPKERDLMFVLADDPIPSRTEQMFLEGYGPVQIDPLVLAYYRYEWCVQEIGDFGERVFLTEDTGTNTKQDALEGFKTLFVSGDVVDAALRTPVDLR